ncbi:MAG: hypothetical protein FWD39_01365 [Clostridiales bacterium]|nr:hypothetical protein [Clostridiales bacterium]
MKKLILTVWGGHLALCVLSGGMVMILFALGSEWLSLILMPVIISALYIVIGYLANHIVFRHLVDDVKHKKIKPAGIIWSVSLYSAIFFFGLSILAGSDSSNLDMLAVFLYPYFYPCVWFVMALSHGPLDIPFALALPLMLACIPLMICLPSILMHLGFWFGNLQRRKLN